MMLNMDLYHICNRGVDKRDVCIDDHDRLRFVHDLFVMNDSNPTPNHIQARGNAFETERERVPLVHIYAWCLMPNHYHVLLSPIDDDPAKLSLFAQKLGMGYSKFFNEKYHRSGALWQGKYRKVHIQRDAHFLYIPFYIHLNSLDLVMKEWRHGRVKNVERAFEYLHTYRWSSFLDYASEKNFPSIIDMTLLKEILGPSRKQEKVIRDIISDASIANSSFKIEF